MILNDGEEQPSNGEENLMPWLSSVFILVLCVSAAPAADWPQWLGPTRDAASSEVVTPWKETPKVLWRQPVGEGHSSPVVANGRVFLHAKVQDKDEETVIAFDAGTGEKRWQMSYPRVSFSSIFGNGPRATPTVADGKVYAVGVTGVLSCFNAESGEKVWQIDTLKKFQASNLFFGVSCSPLVDAKQVLVNVGGKGASIVSFLKDTGEVLWKNLDDTASYASPILFSDGAQRQAVFFTHKGLVSLNPADGSLYWRFPLVDLLSESSTTPVKVGDMLLASSITYGMAGLRLEKKDDKPSAGQVWKNEVLTCYFATPVAVGTDHVYVVTGTKPPALKMEATLRCIEAKTGKELWQKPKVGQYHATLLRTGDNKLLMLEEAGSLVLIDPSPLKYQELARSRVCGETWAHPALANGRLYVRDKKELLCLDLGNAR
jgi:outer membrane protein assembly factor BamB